MSDQITKMNNSDVGGVWTLLHISGMTSLSKTERLVRYFVQF